MEFECTMRCTIRKIVSVHADSEREARDLFEKQVWDDEKGDEMVDWEIAGPVVEVT